MMSTIHFAQAAGEHALRSAIAQTHSARGSSVARTAILLAALTAGLHLGAPMSASAQWPTAERALLGKTESAVSVSVVGSESQLQTKGNLSFPTGEQALLGRRPAADYEFGRKSGIAEPAPIKGIYPLRSLQSAAAPRRTPRGIP